MSGHKQADSDRGRQNLPPRALWRRRRPLSASRSRRLQAMAAPLHAGRSIAANGARQCPHLHPERGARTGPPGPPATRRRHRSDRGAAWPPDASQGRSGEADEFQGRGGKIHRRASCRLEEREARRAMGRVGRDLRISGHRRPVGRRDRNRARPESTRTDLDEQDGNREPRSRAHRGRARLGDGASTAARREPGALARPSRQAASGENQGPEGQAPRRHALRRRAGVHGEAAGNG